MSTKNVKLKDENGNILYPKTIKEQITDFPTIPTVDQTYSASSTNAQSGTAVSSAILTTTNDLQSQINNLKNIGRFLALWNASTGAPTSEPTTSPYTYRTGDYFRVTTSGTRIPTGTTYTTGGTNWTTGEAVAGDIFFYDGTTWNKQESSSGDEITDVQMDDATVVSGNVASLFTINGDYNSSSNKLATSSDLPTKTSLGLSNVENKSSATIRGEISSSNVTDALGYTPYNSTNPSGYITSSGQTQLSKGTTSGSGNVVSDISVSGHTITLTKGITALTSHQDISGKIDTAGTGLSKSGTTLNHSNSVTEQTTQAVYPIKIDAQGHITGYGSAQTIPTNNNQLTNGAGYITSIGTHYEAYDGWGGRNISGNVSPVDGAIEPKVAGNKMAFASAASIVVQYSTDSGSTWTDYGLTDAQKRALVSTSGGVTCGKGSTTSYAANRLRVILNSNAAGGNTYTSLRKILLYLSTAGASGTKVKVEYRTIANYTSSTDTWGTLGEYGVSGWSGWNSIPFVTAFGGSSSQTSQTAQIRLTFSQTGGSGNLQLYEIKMIGITNWTSPSTMASTGHLYSYDTDQNATFPGKIIKSGGTSSQFLKADGSVDSNSYITSSGQTQLSLTTSGSGNAITALSVSNHAITATKGSTFLTSETSLSLSSSGSGNAITALSVSGHTITATKGSTFALSSAIPTVTNYYWANVKIGSSSSTSTTPTFSTCTATSFYATSDKRKKENFEEPEIDYLDTINKLKLYEYNFIDDKDKDNKYIGLIAQDLQEVLPNKYKNKLVNVGDDEDKTLSISEGKLGYILLGALQEQQKEIELLKKEIEELKKGII